MPAPTQVQNHVQLALSRLTSRYSDPLQTPNVVNLLTAFATRIQQMDNDFWTLLSGILTFTGSLLASGPWDIYDKIGAIVGEVRNGRSDADYVAAIKLRIRVLNSNGLAEDIIQISQILTPGATYLEWPPAAWEVDAFDISSSAALALILYLGEADPAGVAGNLRFTIDTQPYVQWSNHGQAAPPGVAFGDHVSGSPAAALCSLQKVS